MASNSWVHVQQEKLDIDRVTGFLYHQKAGGVNIFAGTTRKWTGERETVELSYECYQPLALKEMQALIEQAEERWPIIRACIVHRLGVVPVAEASVLIGVATPHRADAFEACKFLIDQLKVQVPIWKKEHYADGTTEWVQGRSKPEVR